MADPLVISIDAMGGDHGPAVVIPGAAKARRMIAGDVRFLLHGDRQALTEAVSRAPDFAAVSEIRPAGSVISMDAKPAHAMRRGKGSSMWNAIESVRSGEAVAAVSAGNTGALMAIARLILRMTGNLDRPALVANWPTLRGITSVLDVGANIVCDAGRLTEFAVMGSAYHRAIHRSNRPTVGLLNVGTEHDKGHEEVKGADRLLSRGRFEFDYLGFVEGDDIAKGAADVIVTDGFTGNIALKTAEGLARFFRAELRKTFTASVSGKAGAFLARRALADMAARLDPGSINGGPFLGLNGIVVKSHGGADAGGVANAIRLAAELGAGDFAGEIGRNLAEMTPTTATGGASV
ncbi:MAG TPA: phosphate acyltransferase PlsX [Caulobacteraceae bacterium]|nr:phosphate acyltransferase PlsX [Caulobacteraceae bacterium]